MPVYRITVSGVCLGQTIQNVFHVQRDTADFTLAAIAVKIRDSWCGLTFGFHTSSFAYNSVRVEDVTTNPTPNPATLSIAIAGSGTPTTPHVALCIILKFQTSFGGRTGRGRIYLGAPRSDWVANSVVSSGGVSFINSSMIPAITGAWLAGGTTGLRLVVAPKSDPTNFKDVINIALAPGIYVQRRRNIGVGI